MWPVSNYFPFQDNTNNGSPPVSMNCIPATKTSYEYEVLHIVHAVYPSYVAWDGKHSFGIQIFSPKGHKMINNTFVFGTSKGMCWLACQCCLNNQIIL